MFKGHNNSLRHQLRRICEFIGYEFESEMLWPDNAQFNGVDGNRLRKQPVEHITLDTAWTREMPPMIRTLTALTVAGFNRRHGY